MECQIWETKRRGSGIRHVARSMCLRTRKGTRGWESTGTSHGPRKKRSDNERTEERKFSFQQAIENSKYEESASTSLL
jgi:hypothetical protein